MTGIYIIRYRNTDGYSRHYVAFALEEVEAVVTTINQDKALRLVGISKVL